MIYRRTFILIFVLFLPADYVFAGGQEISGKNAEEQSWEVLRQKAMDEELSKFMSRREKMMEEECARFTARRDLKMEEVLRKLSVEKNKGKLLLPRSAWYVSQKPEKKDSAGKNKFFNLQNTRNALGTYFESETEERKITSSSIPSQRKRMLLEESLETDFKPFFYSLRPI